MNYKAAGVDIDAGEALVERIKPIAKKTSRPEVLGGLGGFGALFEISKHYQEPVLVSSTDGVGTKLKIALMLKKHDTIGIDLVAMCVNDIIVQGAEPLFFLDYFATGHLNVDIAADVIKGIGLGCEQAGAALIGGETAEMPGVYSGEDYDLAGFTVGIVEKAKIIDGSQVKPGDVLIALASSGPHSNGYSLIRKIIAENNSDLNHLLNGKTVSEALLEPTKIYVKSILQLIKKVPVHAIAHITGGGIIENLPRVLPQYTQATINKNSWQWPEIFSWLQRQGNVAEQEMYRTFNCGVGMIICVAKDSLTETLNLLKDLGETAWQVGEVEASSELEPVVILN